MPLRKLLALVASAALVTGASAQSISLSTTKVFAVANTAVTFDVNYLAALAANQNKAAFTVRVRPELAPGGNFAVPVTPTFGFTNIYPTCLDVGVSPDYNGGTGNASVTWSAPINEWPNLAACGSQTSTFRIATFSGTVNAFTAGKSSISVLGSPFGTGTSLTFDVCEKRIVTSMAAGAAVTEGTAASYTVTLDANTATGCDFTIPITLSGPATVAPDTYATTATASCAAGVNTCTFTAGNGNINDTLANGTRTLTASIAATAADGGTGNYVTLAARNANASILDDEISISVAATTPAASETGPTNGVVTFSRGGATTAAQTMTSAISGTATYTADFSLTAGTCTIGAQSATSITVTVPIGSATCTVNVVPVNDTLVEPSETVIFGIPTAASPAISAGSAATVTIADNDALTSVAVTAAGSCAEALVPTNCTFTVTATSNSNPVSIGAGPSVPFTIGGTATNGTDYKLVLGVASNCAAGAAFTGPVATVFGTPTVLTVCVIDDLIQESGGETVILTLTADAATPATYALTTASATNTISDDDSPQVVSVAVAGSPAAEAGGVLTYNFARTGGSLAAQAAVLTVNVMPLPVNATRYSTTCGATLTFAASTATASCTVTGVNDNIVTGSTSVSVAVANPTTVGAYTIGASPAIGQILDDDQAFTPTAVAASVTEGAPAVFNLNCGGATGTFTVAYTITGADAGVTVTPSATSASMTCTGQAGLGTVVTVPTINDVIVGNNRTVTLRITSVAVASGGSNVDDRAKAGSIGIKQVVVGNPDSASVQVLDNDVPTSVPTMGAAGLGLMSLMLVGLAAFQRRRRQQ